MTPELKDSAQALQKAWEISHDDQMGSLNIRDVNLKFASHEQRAAFLKSLEHLARLVNPNFPSTFPLPQASESPKTNVDRGFWTNFWYKYFLPDAFDTVMQDVAAAIDEYLKSLKPVPSPYLVHGRLSEAAKRGEKHFIKAGCADCHVPGLYTDLQPHDVGTRAAYDGPMDKFYTPTLIEVWRTAPYLHNGSAATIRDVLTTRNQNGLHGDVSRLSSQDLDDLCEYVLSL